MCILGGSDIQLEYTNRQREQDSQHVFLLYHKLYDIVFLIELALSFITLQYKTRGSIDLGLTLRKPFPSVTFLTAKRYFKKTFSNYSKAFRYTVHNR